jgi:hypothetical protein
MNMENRSSWPTSQHQAVSTEPMADIRGQTPGSRQEIWSHAQRLYALGELGAAAQLFTQLATTGYQRQEELEGETING